MIYTGTNMTTYTNKEEWSTSTPCVCTTTTTTSPINVEDVIFFIFIPAISFALLIITILIIIIIRLCYRETQFRKMIKMPTPTVGSPLGDLYDCASKNPNQSPDISKTCTGKENRNPDESQQFSRSAAMERFLARSNIGTSTVRKPASNQSNKSKTIIYRMKQVVTKSKNTANSKRISVSGSESPSYKQQSRTEKRKLSDEPISVTVK